MVYIMKKNVIAWLIIGIYIAILASVGIIYDLHTHIL